MGSTDAIDALKGYSVARYEARPARGPGRPQIGRRVLVTLSEAQIAAAQRLGDGVIAAGIRAALDASDRSMAIAPRLE